MKAGEVLLVPADPHDGVAPPGLEKTVKRLYAPDHCVPLATIERHGEFVLDRMGDLAKRVRRPHGVPAGGDEFGRSRHADGIEPLHVALKPWPKLGRPDFDVVVGKNNDLATA